MYTKEVIQEKIRTNIAWTIRTLEVLYNRQTEDEREFNQTSHKNGMGFNGTDGELLSSFYVQLQRKRKNDPNALLSEKQLEICKKLLPKYWKQIQEEIKRKANEANK